MQTVPNWQAIAQNYYFSGSSNLDTIRQMHLNRNSTLAEVHFQREGVVSYYNAIMKKWSQTCSNPLIQLKARKMAEAQFGLILIGIV